jgi:hypothetical protein
MFKNFLFLFFAFVTANVSAGEIEHFNIPLAGGADFTTYFTCKEVNDCLDKERARKRNLWFKKCLMQNGSEDLITTAIMDNGVLRIRGQEHYLIFGYLDGDLKSKRIFAYWNAPVNPDEPCYLPKNVQFLGTVILN